MANTNLSMSFLLAADTETEPETDDDEKTVAQHDGSQHRGPSKSSELLRLYCRIDLNFELSHLPFLKILLLKLFI